MDKLKQRFSNLKLGEEKALKQINNVKQDMLKIEKRESKKKNFDKEDNFVLLKEQKWSKGPYRHLISSFVQDATYKKFISLAHRGATYSLKFLKGPSEKFLESKKVILEEPKNSKKKFLLLDLDQTLIHTVSGKQPYEVNLKLDSSQSINFNVRPHCYDFLRKMSQHYTIYVFTASTYGYAKPIIQYLNRNQKTIHDFLCRNNCMQTKNGFYIKDLRIVSNRTLKDIILVDNLVHSFGLQIDNGIPIVQYRNDEKDCELPHVANLLMEAKDHDDVRKYIQNKLALKGLIDIDEKQFDIE